MKRLPRSLGLTLLAWSAAACTRAAPGPEECVPFVEQLLRVTHEDALASSSAKQQFDVLMTACLTTPFHRDVFKCTAATRSPYRCLKQYEPTLKNAPPMGDSIIDSERRRERY